MKWFKARSFGPALRLALLSIPVLFAGCRTAPQTPLFVAAGSGWHVQEGQALWRPRRGYPELGGDLVLASHADGRCLVQFAKTPMALVSAQTTPTRWQIQFPPRRLSFTGGRHRSSRFAWLYLQPALSGEPLPPPLRFERKLDGGWRLENGKSGETLEGFLAP